MAEINYSMVQKVLDSMAEYERKSIGLKIVSKEGIGVTDSKFGGTPYVPRSVNSIPTTRKGTFLTLLAQFNLLQLPKNIFPANQGILQFFIDGDDDISGADFDNWANNDGFRVLFYSAIEEDYLTCHEVKALYQDYKPEYLPITEGEWGIAFTEKVEGLAYTDYRFDDIFISKWNELYQDNPISYLYDDLPDELCTQLFDAIHGFDHKLLGYPAFTQNDPREYDKEYREYELLFQMDSESGKELSYDIMWGDSGICNFFIRPDDLVKLDFSKVGYNWDCY
ncbi:MAG: YwqG family protein [Eubacteriales bacterium]